MDRSHNSGTYRCDSEDFGWGVGVVTGVGCNQVEGGDECSERAPEENVKQDGNSNERQLSAWKLLVDLDGFDLGLGGQLTSSTAAPLRTCHEVTWSSITC